MNAQREKIMLLSHISDLSGPTEQLELFLVREKIEALFLIYNPLEYCNINKRIVKLYEKGKLKHELYPSSFKCGRIITWIYDTVIILIYSMKFDIKYDKVICCDALNGIVGLLLRKIRKCRELVFYSIDWTPKRFENKILNIVYQKINDYCIKRANTIWTISKRLINVQISKGVDPLRIQYVPVGVNSGHSEFIDKDVEYKTLVFLGALEKTKGIEVVIESWEHLLKKDKHLKLVVIGKTPGSSRQYEDVLEKMPNVEVLGVLPHEEVLRILPKYGIGLAPYTFDDSSVSFYGDPSRIKDYLTCGLPVVVTKVPEIADVIDKNHAGKIIGFSVESLINGIIDLTHNQVAYFYYKNNAIGLAKEYIWDNIFATVFKSERL